MPLALECFGLSFLEEEETFGDLMGFVARNGKPIVGYYGTPYFSHKFGSVELILRTARCKDGEGLEALGMDSHASGKAVWEVRLSSMNIQPRDADLLERRIVATHSNGNSGMVVVNLVNADVLPGFAEGDLVKMQVVGLPKIIRYYPDEKAYTEDQASTVNGKKVVLHEGSVFPSGLMQNRNPDSPNFESDERLDDIVHIRGTVKELYYGTFEMDGVKENTFISCFIDTSFGPLEIDHCIAQVDKAQQKNIRVGAVVDFHGIISGDVAIYEYENGLIRDEAHDLAVLRYAFTGGDMERLRSILAEDAIYCAEYYNECYKGPDAIIARLKLVQESHLQQYFAHWATIASVDESAGPAAYGIGKRCLVLASEEENQYESIVFIDTDDDGNIIRIITSIDPKYQFVIQKKKGGES